MKPSQATKANKESRVQSRVSRAKKQTPASTAGLPDLATQVAELQEQIAALRAGMEHGAWSVEAKKKSSVERPASSALVASTASSPLESSSYSTGLSYQPSAVQQPSSTLDPRLSTTLAALSKQIDALRAQISTLDARPSPPSAEQPPLSPNSDLRSPNSTAQSPATCYSPLATGAPPLVTKPLPVYELKETRPIGYRSQDILDSSSEESGDGFFTGLLDRARMQWLMGDWEALSKLDLEQIQHHPDRAKLALLVSAGLMQGGHVERAKQHLAQAYRWGVPKKLAFSILYSGVRQNLHEATKGKVSSGTPLTDGSTEARIGLSSPPSSGADSASILGKLSQLHDAVQSLSPLLASGIKTVSDELIRVRKYLDSVIQRDVNNAARQVQASAAVQHYLGTGELLPFHPESDTWPITPDFAFSLVQLLETRDYDLVVEFGSGLSTVLVARCLVKINRKRHGKSPVRFLSFDHLSEFHGRTLALLQQAGLADRVELCLAPLAGYTAPNGRTYSYYTCQERLTAFAGAQSLAGLKVLAIVDGPPAATGENARYPAGPILAQAFSGATLDILLDDLVREDERQVAKLWEGEFHAAGRSCATRILKLQKEACLLEIH